MPNDIAHRDFMLSALRTASLRAKMMEVEITTVGIALKGNLISVGESVQWLRDIGALEFVGIIPDVVTKETEKSS
jgi:hypothetical protein